MKALVLGGSRFIGLRLVWLLHGQGHEVTVLNRGQTRTELPDGVTRLYVDRTDARKVKDLLKDADYDVAFDISAYTTATLNPVIEALEDRIGHFVFCSTTSVYPPADVVPILEDFPLYRSPEAGKYAADKVECEDLLMDAFEKRGFPATILRPPYVYGPHDYIKEREFSYFARLTQMRKIIIPGDGLTLIHPVHVDDLAGAFAAVPGRNPALGQAYTICSPDAVTANGYVRTIGEVMGVETKIVHVESNAYNALGQQLFPYEWEISQVYSNEKAMSDLEWSPKYHMRGGLDMTYRWWLEEGLDKQDWDFSAEDDVLAKLGALGTS